jgi:hypothetical protein
VLLSNAGDSAAIGEVSGDGRRGRDAEVLNADGASATLLWVYLWDVVPGRFRTRRSPTISYDFLACEAECGEPISAAESAPRQLASLPNGIASLQGPSARQGALPSGSCG